MDSSKREEFQAAVWSFYREAGRRFPWRETTNPYEILVSELMLQQTQTERVVPKYTAWLERFPTVESVAAAPLADVLEKWSGLGYNRRARFLQEACRAIVEEHGGTVPREPEKLQKLKGVGEYTARAISCFAYGTPTAFIETNIRAVYLYFFFQDRLAAPAIAAPAETAPTKAVSVSFVSTGSANEAPAAPKAAPAQSHEVMPAPEAISAPFVSTGSANEAPAAPKAVPAPVADSELLPLIRETLPEAPRVREWYYALMDYGAALKKRVKNPNRHSKGYTKQSAFEGSLRQARGVIVRQLTKCNIDEKKRGFSLSEIQNREYIEYECLQKAAQSLCAEGLIEQYGDTYRIADTTSHRGD